MRYALSLSMKEEELVAEKPLLIQQVNNKLEVINNNILNEQ